MPVNDRALFKAFQVFTLDVLDALGHEDDTKDDSSLRAAEREAAAAPVVARPRKAERRHAGHCDAQQGFSASEPGQDGRCRSPSRDHSQGEKL